jgi:hypothetical protein
MAMPEDLQPGGEWIALYPRLFQPGYPHGGIYLPSGWRRLLANTLEQLDQALDSTTAAQFRVLQIKDKFGELRVYWSLANAADDERTGVSVRGDDQRGTQGAPTQAIRRILSMARCRLATVCEVCGRPGEQTGQSWISMLCRSCETERLSVK